MSRKIIEDKHHAASEDSIDDADQVEWRAIRDGAAAIEFAILDNLIAEDVDSSDDSLGRQGGDWYGRESKEAERVGAASGEIDRREMVLSDFYPFETDGKSVTYKPVGEGFGVYEFLLAISMSDDYRTEPFNRIPQCFERFSTELVSRWMGANTKGWQTGWPGRKLVGLPGPVAELWNQIYEETGEWKFDPDADLSELAAEAQKDLGIDFLCYKKVPDYRTHALFVAGQCACGKDVLPGGKSNDINRSWLNAWFRPPKVDFVSCLATPRCFGGSTRTHKARAGVLFLDRIRLALMAGESECPEFSESGLFDELTKMILNQ